MFLVPCIDFLFNHAHFSSQHSHAHVSFTAMSVFPKLQLGAILVFCPHTQISLVTHRNTFCGSVSAHRAPHNQSHAWTVGPQKWTHFLTDTLSAVGAIKWHGRCRNEPGRGNEGIMPQSSFRRGRSSPFVPSWLHWLAFYWLTEKWIQSYDRPDTDLPDLRTHWEPLHSLSNN